MTHTLTHCYTTSLYTIPHTTSQTVQEETVQQVTATETATATDSTVDDAAAAAAAGAESDGDANADLLEVDTAATPTEHAVDDVSEASEVCTALHCTLCFPTINYCRRTTFQCRACMHLCTSPRVSDYVRSL
jgi:hypothetical protein